MRTAFTLVVLLTAAGFTEAADVASPRLTPRQLDTILSAEKIPTGAATSDEQFLRRASLDLIGRPPSVDELAAFLNDTASDKRARAIDRLLESKEFGRNWANYWSDTISWQVPPPELTFLSYRPFKAWLADRLNANTGWDLLTRDILTASGPIKDNPAVTFVGYHRGNSQKLAAETSRIFLSLQLQCAQCHNHKFDHWKRRQFHELAAFFARTDGKLGTAQDGSSTIVSDKGKGEYVMAHASDPKKPGTTLVPLFLTSEAGLDMGATDLERRTMLADLLTRPDNPWFARSYVNRMWSRLMGCGFYEPVDNVADYQKEHQRHLLPRVHQAVATHFVATGFDIKDFFRLVMNTEAYQRVHPLGEDHPTKPSAPRKLRGDEVFASLSLAIGLPNFTPAAVKPTAAIRFPPPPKSTCDVVVDQFGYDPSFAPEDITRSMAQAMLLMNNDQVQKQIDADPKSGTLLSQLLQKESDDRKAVTRLFLQVMARQPSAKEMTIALDHVKSVGKRGDAFEDILWGLINSAEFTTRK